MCHIETATNDKKDIIIEKRSRVHISMRQQSNDTKKEQKTSLGQYQVYNHIQESFINYVS